MDQRKNKMRNGKIKEVVLKIWNNKKNRYLFMAFIVAIITILAFSLTRENDTEPIETIREVSVTRGDLMISNDGDGKAVFPTQSLRFSVKGEIKDILVKVGDKVQEGEVIARLHSDDYEIELTTAKLNYEQAVFDAEQKIKTLELAYHPMEEAPELFTPKEIEAKKIELETALRNHSNTINNNAAIIKAQKNLDSTVLKAPAAGTILSIPGTLGKNVSETEEIVVFSIIEVYVTSNILEYDIDEIEVGQVMEAEFDAMPDKIYKGRVIEIDMMPVQESSGVTAYKVKSQLDEPDTDILPGMSCLVNFIFEQEKNVLLIPNLAVRMVDGKQLVEVYDENKSIISKEVITGFTDGINVEVISGLELGGKVLIRTITYPASTSGNSTVQQPAAFGVPTGGSGIPGSGLGGFH